MENIEFLMRQHLERNANHLFNMNNWLNVLTRLLEEHKADHEFTTRLAIEYVLKNLKEALSNAQSHNVEYRNKLETEL